MNNESNILKFGICGGDAEVTVEVTQEKLEAILNKIVDFAKKTSQVSGEGIAQNDDCNIYASSLLGDIWDDVLKPKVDYKD